MRLPEQPQEWEAAFFDALEETGGISSAAQAAGTGCRKVYDRKRADPRFAGKCLDALDVFDDYVLAHAVRQAFLGKRVPARLRGRVVGYEIRRRDILLIRAHRTLMRQGERVLRRAQAQRSAPRAAAPSKPPTGSVVTGSDGADRPWKWEPVFLEVLEKTGVTRFASQAAGISPQTVYDCQRGDPEFALRCLDALEGAADCVFAEIMRRALVDERVPVRFRGSAMGCKTRTRVTLLIFMHRTLRQQVERSRRRAQARVLASRPAAGVAMPASSRGRGFSGC